MNKDKLINIARRTVSLASEKDIGVYAGNATLFLITAMFPLIMLIVSIINLLPGYSPDSVMDQIFQYLPDFQSMKPFMEGVVENLKEETGSILASISAITTLWSASSGVRALQKGLKAIGNVENRTVKDIIAALAFTVLLILFIPIILIFTIFGDSLEGLLLQLASRIGHTGIINTLVDIVNIGAIIASVGGFFVLLFMYTYLPGVRRSLKVRLPGTIIVYVVVLLFTKLFSFYIPRFYNSSAIYGSLASLFLILMYLRLLVTLLLYGAALNEAWKKEMFGN